MICPDREPPNDEQASAEADVQSLIDAADELAALYGAEREVIIRALDIIIRKQAALERLRGMVQASMRSPAG